MKTWWEFLQEKREQGKKCALAMIISDRGSAPRKAGSEMLVCEDGSVFGTVGGGAVEYHSQQAAEKAIEEQRSFVKSFALNHGPAQNIGMVCGGEAELFFQYVAPEDESFDRLCRGLARTAEEGRDSWLVFEVSEDAARRTGLCFQDSGKENFPAEITDDLPERPGCRTAGGKRYFILPVHQEAMVYLFGGGHVSLALAQLLPFLGFRYAVMDDREEFANRERFPGAERVIVGDMRRLSEFITFHACDYVCVMTRGHEFDYQVEKQILLSPAKPRYAGVIGSRTKTAFVTGRLKKDGFSQQEINFFYAPIGLDIGSETPEEIAVSIAAQMIAVRRGKGGRR